MCSLGFYFPPPPSSSYLKCDCATPQRRCQRWRRRRLRLLTIKSHAAFLVSICLCFNNNWKRGPKRRRFRQRQFTSHSLLYFTFTLYALHASSHLLYMFLRYFSLCVCVFAFVFCFCVCFVCVCIVRQLNDDADADVDGAAVIAVGESMLRRACMAERESGENWESKAKAKGRRTSYPRPLLLSLMLSIVRFV